MRCTASWRIQESEVSFRAACEKIKLTCWCEHISIHRNLIHLIYRKCEKMFAYCYWNNEEAYGCHIIKQKAIRSSLSYNTIKKICCPGNKDNINVMKRIVKQTNNEKAIYKYSQFFFIKPNAWGNKNANHFTSPFLVKVQTKCSLQTLSPTIARHFAASTTDKRSLSPNWQRPHNKRW